VEPIKAVEPSDAMIYDSSTIHRRYVGEAPAPISVPKNVADAAAHKAQADRNSHKANQRSIARPAVKKPSKSGLEGKSASYWDEESPELKQKVSTADFSVPAGPLPLQSDEVGAKSASGHPVVADGDSASSRSRAWFVIGALVGLAVSAVIFRRWRDNCTTPLT
jgi:hypothetical protein